MATFFFVPQTRADEVTVNLEAAAMAMEKGSRDAEGADWDADIPMQITGGSGITTNVKILSRCVQSDDPHPMDTSGRLFPPVIQLEIASERRYNGKVGENHIPAPGCIRETPDGRLVPCANPRCTYFAREGRNYCCGACCSSGVYHLCGGPYHSSTCTCFTDRSVANGRAYPDILRDRHGFRYKLEKACFVSSDQDADLLTMSSQPEEVLATVRNFIAFLEAGGDLNVIMKTIATAPVLEGSQAMMSLSEALGRHDGLHADRHVPDRGRRANGWRQPVVKEQKRLVSAS